MKELKTDTEAHSYLTYRKPHRFLSCYKRSQAIGKKDVEKHRLKRKEKLTPC
jgi:hypothetical protein